MPAIPKPLPEQLKAVRAKYGLSQRELGELLGVHTQTVYAWEAGKKCKYPLMIEALIARIQRQLQKKRSINR